jgi:hypothetical protein
MKAAITHYTARCPKYIQNRNNRRCKEFACYGKVKDEGIDAYFAMRICMATGQQRELQWLVEEVLSQENRFGKVHQKDLTHSLFLKTTVREMSQLEVAYSGFPTRSGALDLTIQRI